MFRESRSSRGGVAGADGSRDGFRWMKAKGRWPFSESGMPITQASATEGWVRRDCSIDPAILR